MTPLNDAENHHLLASLAAMQLLSGCTFLPGERILSENRHSVDLSNGNIKGLPRLTLHMVSTLSLQVHRGDISSGRAWESSKSLDEALATLNSGAKGHINFPSDNTSHISVKANKAIGISGPLDNNLGSEELDRRLQAIDEALCQQKSERGRYRSRLYTSEVSRTEDLQNIYDTKTTSPVQIEESGNLDGRPTSQYADPSRHSDMSNPSGESTNAWSLLGSSSEVGQLYYCF